MRARQTRRRVAGPWRRRRAGAGAGSREPLRVPAAAGAEAGLGAVRRGGRARVGLAGVGARPAGRRPTWGWPRTDQGTSRLASASCAAGASGGRAGGRAGTATRSLGAHPDRSTPLPTSHLLRRAYCAGCAARPCPPLQDPCGRAASGSRGRGRRCLSLCLDSGGEPQPCRDSPTPPSPRLLLRATRRRRLGTEGEKPWGSGRQRGSGALGASSPSPRFRSPRVPLGNLCRSGEGHALAKVSWARRVPP
ncbi:PREDICTED: uncharacterized protein LOC108533905 [Rhinopithecus bieti]|uniref:uncharacterized protein LOC108533905 n=1 Tax=Rhinopithecus bieti TaxID=61621 RepID=UPI00083BD2BE|nr:PREDICTED: uncharacterized protein LOC108533905 [Rhinopithecus bieti]